MPTRDSAEQPTVVDVQLAAEIRLLGELIAAAGTHQGPLSDVELDTALGIGGASK